MFETDVSHFERKMIFDALDKFQVPQYLEIGVNFAGSFKLALDHLQKTRDDYFAVGIDLFESLVRGDGQTHEQEPAVYLEVITALVKQHSPAGWRLIRGNSHEEVAKLGQMFDVIFIDGNHTYQQTRADFEACILKTHPGSIILFHNAAEREYPEDGGPWAVCSELASDDRVKSINIPRLNVKKKIFERTWGFEVR